MRECRAEASARRLTPRYFRGTAGARFGLGSRGGHALFGIGNWVLAHCDAMKAMESKVARCASLPKDEVQQTRDQGSRDRGSGIEHYEAMKAMESKVARCASLYKDEVQRARASQRPSPRRLHGFPAAPMHEDLWGPGV
jgi:hypothetical protein